jgi:drug/metabolite transporter (DMT)-like permease
MRARLALMVTILAWSSSFPAIRVALDSFSPAHVALLRYCVATLALGLCVWRSGAPLPPRRDLARIAVIGALGLGIYNVALAAGEVTVPAGTASLLIATAPIWMAVIAASIGRERIGRRAALGLVVGFAGVGVVQGGGFALDGGVLLLLLAAALQAGYSMAQRPLVERHGAITFLFCAAASATLVLLPTAAGVPAALAAASPRALGAIVFLGLVPGALGYATWAYASTRVSTTAAGAALYLVPPCALLLGWLVLGETPAPSALAGGALVLAGVALARR